MDVTHLALQLSGRTLWSLVILSNTLFASSSACKNKKSNIFLFTIKTSQHGAWLMPRAQTTSLPLRDESTRRARVARPNSMVLVSCSSLRRSVLTAVRAWCPQHGLSGTRDVPATDGVVRRPAPPVCLTPYRRAPHRCRPNHAVTFWSANGPLTEQRSKCFSVCGVIGLCISSLSDQLLRVNTNLKNCIAAKT